MGADVNAPNTAGETPLHAAAVAGLDSVVEFLVKNGASLTAKTRAGKTPLAMAQGTEIAMQLVVRDSTVALLKKLGAQ
jgi:ankyrin repeat protein